MSRADEEFGCNAFGHLVSPFVDGELPKDEHERFAVHLDACRPCRALVASYRALDRVASLPPPPVAEAAWDGAWSAVQRAIENDRTLAADAPLASVARLGSRIGTRSTRSRWIRPLGYAAAAAVLVALTLRMQPRWDVPQPEDRASVAVSHVPAAVPAAADEPQAMTIACLVPDFLPVIYTVDADGDDPMTVVQCLWIGEEPVAAPTEG